MIRLRARYARRPDDGVAMLFVIAIGLIVTAFFVAMFTSVLNTQRSAQSHRNITSAEAAAEAGLNDAVFKLGQYTNGISNWSTYTTGASQWTKTNPFTPTGGFGANATYAAWVTPIAGSSNVTLWSQGTFAGNTRTVRAQLTRGSPPAFDYSMFASKGIDIHHHNSSWLSPQVWTTSVHSNGYINIDYSAEFTVNSMEAVGNLLMAKGGGSTPGGSIPSSGYNWYDPLNGKCYPGGMTNPGGVAPPAPATCSSSPSMKYSPNAVVSGTVKAGSVTITSHGQVLPAAATTMDTGQQILDQPGDVYAGSATVGSTSFTTTAQGDACNTNQTVCNKGANATAGQISGMLHVTPGYTPETVAFPSINFASSPYHAGAVAQGHVFTSVGTFLTYITDPANGFYRTIGTQAQNYALQPWTTGSTVAPDVIYLNGDWAITGGSATLSYSTIAGMVHAATGTNGPAPIVVIQGSFIVENGGVKLNTGLVMVGTGNNTNFLRPGTATTPVIVDTSASSTGLLDPAATMPAILAAGGSIDSSDYDTDSGWTSTSVYEPAKATPTYIRGLVYSATWNSTTQTSVPAAQHWHNYDPKNLQKIYGAQVGSQLHDCNNFSFSYDPLVKNAFGFGGGTVSVVDYQELGS